jgi:hypothetical protein
MCKSFITEVLPREAVKKWRKNYKEEKAKFMENSFHLRAFLT